jgi:hypothetical protein
MLNFDSIALEVYINGGWTNIFPDVLASPRLKWNRGIMGNRPSDHVGYPGTLTFNLKNDASCLGGKVGYYSPNHTNCWAGWTTGLPVRISFVFEGQPFYKFYGRIKQNGITVTPGQRGQRDVAVEVGDWMYFAGNHEMKTTIYATNQNIGQLVNLVNANMPFSPLTTSIATGVENFPSIFDMTTIGTTALSEYVKGAMSEWGYIYVKGDKTGGETLVVEAQNTRTNKTADVIPVLTAECGQILAEDGSGIQAEDGTNIVSDDTRAAVFDNLMSDPMQVGYGRTMANRVTSVVYPRTPATGVTLWSLNKSFQILPLQTITGYRCKYIDPNSQAVSISADQSSLSTSATATANEDGSGASMTSNLVATPAYGSDSTIYTLYNNNTTTALWVQTLTITGNGVYTYTSVQNVQDNTASEAVNGIVPLTLDFKYQANSTKANVLSAYVLGQEALPYTTIDAVPMWANMDELRMFAFLIGEPGEKMTFKEAISGINGDYFINGYTAELYEKKYILFTPVLSKRPVMASMFYVYNQGNLYRWQSVCWSPGLSLFCAVGFNIPFTIGCVMTSPDGITWTSRTAAANNNWISVCWSPDKSLFCAVAYSGTGNRVMTSPDGTTWTSRTSTADITWYSVCWSPEKGLFCAVGYDTADPYGYVMTSPDGTTWTSRTAVDNPWVSVCWSSTLGLFCAVGYKSSLGAGYVMTSPDGITWTSRTAAANNNWCCICWSPTLGIFAAVARAGTTGTLVMTSVDGINWTVRTNPVDNEWLYVAWSPEFSVFVAVSDNTRYPQFNQIMTSVDGINWETGVSPRNDNWHCICWSPQLLKFVAVSDGQGYVMSNK